jgi:3-hydroxy-3-methylglutaryl CoA synthase
MMLAHSAAEKILSAHAGIDRSRLGLVLGSSLGEIEVTKDFLMTFAASGVARPFLFQNSLHNATIGFLCLQFGITGPTATVSTRYYTGEDSLELAMTWIDNGLAEQVLVAAVDTYPKELLDVARALLPKGCVPGQGAAAVLLGKDGGGKKIVKIERGIGAPEELKGPFYESDFLENFVTGYQSKPAIKSVKPDRTFSLTHVS